MNLLNGKKFTRINFTELLKVRLNRIMGKRKNVLFDVDVKGGINLKKIFGTGYINIHYAAFN